MSGPYLSLNLAVVSLIHTEQCPSRHKMLILHHLGLELRSFATYGTLCLTTRKNRQLNTPECNQWVGIWILQSLMTRLKKNLQSTAPSLPSTMLSLMQNKPKLHLGDLLALVDAAQYLLRVFQSAVIKHGFNDN